MADKNKMTALAKAKQKAKKDKEACYNCEKSEIVRGLLYCGVTGKIIMPRFEHMCLCRGKLKECK